MVRPSPRLAAGRSLSARRAWIEISVVIIHILPFLVALRKESVDRNWCSNTAASACYTVALRKESVDRNTGASAGAAAPQVALRKESVDRNILRDRRHWQMGHVALRKESVDRNIYTSAISALRSCRSPQGERG